MQRTDISAFVAEAAEEVPERQALVESGGRSLTWAQLEDEVGRIATGLGAEGIRAGQRVMLVVGNRIEFVTAYLGVLRAQVVAVPVNPRSAPGEIARMIADSGTRLVVVDESALDVVRQALIGARRRTRPPHRRRGDRAGGGRDGVRRAARRRRTTRAAAA